MSKGYNAREIILELLLEINEEGVYCHTAIGNALKKYQFLPKQDRAFITRVCEGTVEYAIQIDYIINYFSKIIDADWKWFVFQGIWCLEFLFYISVSISLSTA